jgi:protein-disulfide isomerase
MRTLVAAILCLGCAGAQVKSSSALDKPTLEAYLRHLLALPPDVQVKIDDPKPAPITGFKDVDVHLSLGASYQDETFFVSNDGKQIIRGYAYNVNTNPFQPELDKLKTDQSPSFGAAAAPVVMVVFSDFQCPNCKEEAKVMRDNIPAKFPKEVRLYFKDFPLEAIHPWAKAGAICGRCVYRQSPTAFWKYHDWIYEHQGEVKPENLKDMVLAWAQTNELDTLQLGRCIETRATEAEIDKEIAEGRALKVQGTPTTFLNGRRLFGNLPWSNLEQLITQELKYQQTQHSVNEKCCELTIPSLVKN